ncbi:MAG: response regulator transcription factor [Candidatus Marinimicrobia bacterium]|nr:response regulator transcription factor [Candidatus Neomarinimicrobiota bacterium]MBT3824826.1 response regulator transcription factor [Candidatus Neomarinimicrobiota bacterium]MBT4035129.1 response regulator transcription factor [Candidatus Neomarinimicrobiota bacterium]MBT4296332.1 response regulator transcription factor [Candidatus Neomarinimicrobiota bacterium]MBT4714708.1 response regulator transcription factor [Candidatus Neomarinimicrobiota bacterium]
MPKRKPMVLIVEDDLSSQQYYEVIFEDEYEITMVSTVAEAKQALKENVFEVAIVDISLPGGKSGIDMIEYLCSNYHNKPVAIVVTAHAFQENRDDVLEAGAAEFFSKPVLSENLLAAVRKYCVLPS